MTQAVRNEINGEKLQAEINRCWTVQDVCGEYGVTPMAVHLWRGRGLPTIVIQGHGRPAVRFVPSDVRAWAENNGIQPLARTG